MANAKPGIYTSQLKSVNVAEFCKVGCKFLYWDEDSTQLSQVNLKVDPKGYVLFWRDSTGEVDCLEIAAIRDTRNGRSARIPKDAKMKEACAYYGSSEALVEDRTVTVIYGIDLVNIQCVNFVATSRKIAMEWCSELFQYATNTFVANPSFHDLLEKTYTRLTVTATDGHILLKNFYRSFASHKDDRRRIDSALSKCKLLNSKDLVEAKNFSFDSFIKFYTTLCPRSDIDRICHELNPSCRGKQVAYINTDQVISLINDKQRDPRLNEILYPYANEAKANEIIRKYETDISLVQKGHISSKGLHAYLISTDNAALPIDKIDVSQDMEQPLPHYFINSSHNTYLAGHQLTGKSSAELYRQVLLTGCRCVELDCWDGKGADEEPVITHGFTMCTEVSFRETMEAIAETAFKVSNFPVILSFENHCSQKQQAKMVKLIKDYLGDRLLSQPLDSHPLEPATQLPSPLALQGKFLIKNKKRHFKKEKPHSSPAAAAAAASSSSTAAGSSSAIVEESTDIAEEFPEEEFDEDPELQKLREAAGAEKEERVSKEPAMLSAISAMVNYIEPAPFYSFEYAFKKNVSYECCSIAETNATNLLKEFPEDFVNFNKRQVSRIYPKGTRVDSSNYMPQLFWNAGCQLVALNFQTPDLGLQLNLGIFHYQKKCGYLLKPEFMRRSDRRFDPFSESTVDGIVANTLSVQIISGFFLSEKRVGTYVEVEMYGLPADTVRRRFRTKTVTANGINPVFNQDPFVFKKVVLPHLATLRIIAYEESGKVIGQRFLPADSLRPGYRHICLFSELMQPLSLATLFVLIKVNDYVSDAFAELAAALANPIQYMSEKDKHQQQLKVLTEDFDVEENHHAAVTVATAATADSAMLNQQQQQQQQLPITSASSSAAAEDKPSFDAASALTAAAAASAASASETQATTSAHNPVDYLPVAKSAVGSHSPRHHALGNSVRISAADAEFNEPSDPNCVTQLTLDDIKADRRYQKLVIKLSREHRAFVKRFQQDQQSPKPKSTIANNSSNNSNNNNNSNSSSRSSSAQILKHRFRSMRYRGSSADQMLQQQPQNQQQIEAEYQLLQKHQSQLHAELHRVMQSSLVAAEKALLSLYQQEANSLKKSQERQRQLEGKELAKQFKDKTELKEARKEFQQKQISAAVTELQKLEFMHQQRQRQLQQHSELLREQLHAACAKEQQQLQQQQHQKMEAAAEAAATTSLPTSPYRMM